MTQIEIKDDCEKQYSKLRDAKERLNVVRQICKHPTTHEGLYSWRDGCIDDAIICSDCGSLIKYTNQYMNQ